MTIEEAGTLARPAERLQPVEPGGAVIVTGGGHGIGRAICEELASRGRPVVVADLDGPAANKVAETVVAGGGRAVASGTDVTNKDSVEAMVSRATQTFGRVDGLVNNAAVFATVKVTRAPFDQISEEEWDLVMRVNLKGVWLCCRAAVPVMRSGGGGKIVNISSGVAFKGTPDFIHYVTSKAGVVGFTRALAREVGGDGIHVNAVAPGRTLSEEGGDFDAERKEPGTADRCIRRVEVPDDIVGAVAFFLSPAADFITGQTLVVDGGSHLH